MGQTTRGSSNRRDAPLRGGKREEVFRKDVNFIRGVGSERRKQRVSEENGGRKRKISGRVRGNPGIKMRGGGEELI